MFFTGRRLGDELLEQNRTHTINCTLCIQAGQPDRDCHLHLQQGRIKTRQYEAEGHKRYATEIQVQEMTFLSTKKDTNNTPSNINPTEKNT